MQVVKKEEVHHVVGRKDSIGGQVAKVAGKALVEPEIGPPGGGHQVAWGKVVGDR